MNMSIWFHRAANFAFLLSVLVAAAAVENVNLKLYDLQAQIFIFGVLRQFNDNDCDI